MTPDGRPCVEGPPGAQGWSSADDVQAKVTNLQNVMFEHGKEIREGRPELLYVDRTHGELGIRLQSGGRIFVPLEDVLEILRKNVL